MTRKELIERNKVMLDSTDDEVSDLFLAVISQKINNVRKYYFTLNIEYRVFKITNNDIILRILDFESQVELLTIKMNCSTYLEGLTSSLEKFKEKFKIDIETLEIIQYIKNNFKNYIGGNLSINLEIKQTFIDDDFIDIDEVMTHIKFI